MEFWFRRESQAQRQHHHHQQQPCIADAFRDDVVALAVEKGNGFFLGGEDFMVDDLLDLGELETEEEEEEEEEEEDGDDERHKETQQGGLGQGGGEERGKEIVGAEAGEDNKKPDVSFEPEATPSCSPVSELSLPMHDGAELEWVSRIVDDSLSEFPAQAAAAAAAATVAAAEAPDLLVEKLTHRQHQPPPVLKSKRSKRARTLSASSSSSNCSYSSSPSSWGGGAPLLLLDALPTSTSSSSSCSSPLSSSHSPSLSSRFILAHHLFDHIPSLSSANTSSFLIKQNRIQNNPKMLKSKSKKKKKRGRKPKAAAAAAAAVRQGGKGERRCSHCGVNKTPQWRAGPEGAKTLCNACGVRYKSGRLLPEYRPACSPTFISHIHSNSHRKVMEMRRSKEPQEQDDEQEAKGQDRLLLISSVA